MYYYYIISFFKLSMKNSFLLDNSYSKSQLLSLFFPLDITRLYILLIDFSPKHKLN
jgi:hypothetical protein